MFSSLRYEIECDTLNVLSAHLAQQIPPSESFLAAAFLRSLIEVCPVDHWLFSLPHPTLHGGKHSAVAAEREERQIMVIIGQIQIII